MTAASIGEAYARIRDRAGAAVTVVVATKYVPTEQMGLLVDAGIEVVGENRAQDLVEKHARYGERFRWHFIGHLQSNKARLVDGLCELVHSVDSDSSARRLTRPWLLEVNLSGEPAKAGVDPRDIAEWVGRYPAIRGLMTMPPLATVPEDSRPWFRRLRALADEHGLADVSMGTSQDWEVAVEEGATLVRVGSTLFAD